MLGKYIDSFNIDVEENVDPFQSTTEIGIEYLTEYFQTGVGYSFVNTARSVLTIVIKTENEIPYDTILVCRFLNGVFNLRPALSSYSTSWDLSVVLKYIKGFQALRQSDLKSVSYYLAIYLCITIGQNY